MLDITFLRHGESVGNAQGRIQGQSDFPLTEKGLQQARTLAAFWQAGAVSFDRVISSPLDRARATAEIVASALGSPVTLDQAWSERGFGAWEGMTGDEIRQANPGADLFHPTHPPGGNGESLVDLYLRASRAVQELMRMPPGRYLVVTHGAILNMALYAILGLSPLNDWDRLRFRVGNTAFTRLTYDPGARLWSILGFNHQPHLAKDTARPAGVTITRNEDLGI